MLRANRRGRKWCRKPQVCSEIEGASDVVSPDAAAKMFDSGVQRGDFHIASDLPGELLIMSSAGLTPSNNLPLDILCAPVIKIVATVFTFLNDSTVKKYVQRGDMDLDVIKKRSN